MLCCFSAFKENFRFLWTVIYLVKFRQTLLIASQCKSDKGTIAKYLRVCILYLYILYIFVFTHIIYIYIYTQFHYDWDTFLTLIYLFGQEIIQNIQSHVLRKQMFKMHNINLRTLKMFHKWLYMHTLHFFVEEMSNEYSDNFSIKLSSYIKMVTCFGSIYNSFLNHCFSQEPFLFSNNDS